MRVGFIQTLRSVGRKSVVWLQITALVIAGIAPAFMDTPVDAAQLTSRKVTISTSEISPGSGTDVEFAFQYTVPTAGAIQGVIYEFCTTAVGACTLPAGMDVQSNSTHDSQTFTESTAFTKHTPQTLDEGDCTDDTNDYILCFERTDTDPEADDQKLHTISGITAPNTYLTVYIRISTYSDNDFQTADLVDQGTVAAAFVRQLTVTGRVTERLNFCVAAFDDSATVPVDCAAFPTTTEVALGVIDTATVRTPVAPGTAGIANDRYGAFMVNTNASGGVVVTYFPEEATVVTAGDTHQLRTFRVSPTDCSATTASVTDQCFVSAATAGTDFTTLAGGTGEGFGMAVACINTDSGGLTDAFDPDLTGSIGAGYVGDGDDEDDGSDDCENEANDFFGFDDSGNPADLVTSAGVVHDEFVKLQFGAVAAATTPEGSYSVTLTYIATPTF